MSAHVVFDADKLKHMVRARGVQRDARVMADVQPVGARLTSPSMSASAAHYHITQAVTECACLAYSNPIPLDCFFSLAPILFLSSSMAPFSPPTSS